MTGGTEPSQHLDIAVRGEGDQQTVVLDGELDVHTAAQLAEAIDAAVDAGGKVVVDASNLRFCDSSGLQALVAGRERALAAGGSLVVTGVHGPVEKVLSVTGLLDLLTS